MAEKITVHGVLTALNEVRKLTAPPPVGETATRGIDQIVAADEQLLTLQERLLDDYGNDPQSTEFPVPSWMRGTGRART